MPGVLSAIKRTDQKLSELYLERVGERNALLAFYFHGLFRNETEIESGVVDPLEATTIQRFRQFVEYYLACGYSFVSPDDVLKGLVPSKKYVMITFDDAYANNQLALPILKEFRVPAVFHIATGYVKRNLSFWWDVVYRERVKRGASDGAIEREQESLKSNKFAEIEKYIDDQFGADACKPRGEVDRPLTPAELKAFAEEKYVWLGNHTRDHAILTVYSDDEIRQQIVQAQDDLSEITGSAPTSIAYPNGRHSADIRRIARKAGLHLGFTVAHKKNYFPLALHNDRVMRLSRFHLSKKRDCLKQCEMMRSDVLMYYRIRDWGKGIN